MGCLQFEKVRAEQSLSGKLSELNLYLHSYLYSNSKNDFDRYSIWDELHFFEARKVDSLHNIIGKKFFC